MLKRQVCFAAFGARRRTLSVLFSGRSLAASGLVLAMIATLLLSAAPVSGQAATPAHLKTAPPAPTELKVFSAGSRSNAHLVVTWTVPKLKENPPVWGYTLAFQPAGAGGWWHRTHRDVTSTTATIFLRDYTGGPVDGQEFQVKMWAYNAYGSGPDAGPVRAIWTPPFDYDTDDDHLIEVDSLAKLSAIRWDLNGDGAMDTRNIVDTAGSSDYHAAFPYPAANMGCKNGDCRGYELTADLTFDGDGDGRAEDDSDLAAQYCDCELGWEPIGSDSARFNAVLEGNGHTISYLFTHRIGSTTVVLDLPTDWCGFESITDISKEISRDWILDVYFETDPEKAKTAVDVGLFGVLGTGAVVRNLGLENAKLTGLSRVGALAGRNYGVVHSSYVTGSTSGGSEVGGLIGRSYGEVYKTHSTAAVTADSGSGGGLVGRLTGSGSVKASYATGSVTGGDYLGGLVGTTGTPCSSTESYPTSIDASYATGAVTATGGTNTGGLVGDTSCTVSNSYWDTTASGTTDSGGGTGHTTVELKTPTGYSGIYASWDLDLDADGIGDDPWDFGTDQQYPALKADWTRDGSATAAEFGRQKRSARDAGDAKDTADAAAPGTGVSARDVGDAKDTADAAAPGTGVSARDVGDAKDTADAAAPGTGVSARDVGDAKDTADAAAPGTGVSARDVGDAKDTADAAAPGTGVSARDVGDAKDTADAKDAIDVKATVQSDGSVLVVWEPPAGASAFYRIRRAEGLDGHPQMISRHVTPGSGRQVEYHDRDDALQVGQTYRYSVRAFDADGNKLVKWSEAVAVHIPRPNEAPAFTGGGAELSVAENTAAGVPVGDPLTATDPDGNALTYSLSGADAGHFAIDPATGQVKAKGDLDHEAADTYQVTLAATDSGGLSAHIDVTIKVTDVNEAPAFAGGGAALSVAENTAAGVPVGDPLTATDPDGNALTYSLSGADAGHFAIDPATGQVKAKGALDHEAADTYQVTLAATDSGGLSAHIDVTIKVTDVVEPTDTQPFDIRAAVQDDGTVRISWKAPAKIGDDGFYRVRRRLDADGNSYSVISRRVEGLDYLDADDSLRAGQTYTYSVRAFDAAGKNLGRWTPRATVTIPDDTQQ